MALQMANVSSSVSAAPGITTLPCIASPTVLNSQHQGIEISCFSHLHDSESLPKTFGIRSWGIIDIIKSRNSFGIFGLIMSMIPPGG